MWPLPPAKTPVQLWLRAVAAGGQGRYASAHTDLAHLRRQLPQHGPPASLAYSTTASLLRQLGWHDRARHWDSVALRLSGEDPEARGDALVGLAADALGVGRFAVAARLLAEADRLEGGPARHPVRVAWVSAELAMVMGEGAEAVRHARRGVELATGLSSLRHRLKSEVVLAAAQCSAGELGDARAVADLALTSTASSGLVPLSWAVSSLLGGIGSAQRSAGEIAEIRHQAAQEIRQRGGVFAG
ncbi:MAG: hypothetical protein WBB07_15870 [Mycobacterium sp.]